MLEIIGSSLLGLLWEIIGQTPQPQIVLESSSWANSAIFELPPEEFDPGVQNIVDDYLKNLTRQGIDRNNQTVWLQSDWIELGNHRGKIPASAASLTKIATTLAALGKLGSDYQFMTQIYHTGSIEEGTLKGDLVVEGSRDPLFVWEEAIALEQEDPETQLDLARAYLAMGRADEVRNLLDSVLRSGTPEQVEEARAMLREL